MSVALSKGEAASEPTRVETIRSHVSRQSSGNHALQRLDFGEFRQVLALQLDQLVLCVWERGGRRGRPRFGTLKKVATDVIPPWRCCCRFSSPLGGAASLFGVVLLSTSPFMGGAVSFPPPFGRCFLLLLLGGAVFPSLLLGAFSMNVSLCK